jgi:hypothetical protein
VHRLIVYDRKRIHKRVQIQEDEKQQRNPEGKGHHHDEYNVQPVMYQQKRPVAEPFHQEGRLRLGLYLRDTGDMTTYAVLTTVLGSASA